MNLKRLNKICTVLNIHLQTLVQPIYNGGYTNFFFILQLSLQKKKEKIN